MEEMQHVSCFGCGKILANKWNTYKNLLSQGEKPKDALTKIGLERYCCRLRMMNPFKVPIRSERQVDPRDTGLEEQMEKITIATEKQVKIISPLQMMKQTTIAYTIVPEISDITLPEIQNINIPDVGEGIEKEQEGNIVRTYQAW